MPVYTYRCSSCGTQFERHQFFHDAPLKTCPNCKKKALKKVITPTKVIFKGSGFYATDHKSSSSSKSASADKSSSGEKSDGKSSSDAKPEKKSESKASESKSSDKSEQ